jgi:DNA invertase Pin-like site-specific DNA recombinase
LIVERTGTGRAAAKARGVRFGRPPALNADQVRLARRLHAEGMPARDIAATLGVHRATIYRLAAAEAH